jgi:hypothetical protein
MKKLLTPILATALLAGCAAPRYNPLPENYAGPSATVRDSFTVQGISKADFFYVAQVDGHDIDNALWASAAATRGRGMNLQKVPVQRSLPASKPVTLTIVGRTEYAAPIQALTNVVYQVKGTIDFTPKPNKIYVVLGELGETASSVWLEEDDTHEVVGKKIEVKGSAALGFFDK